MTLSTETTLAPAESAAAFAVVPTDAALGAEVRGLDLRNLDATSFERMMHAWYDHSVLLFRGQSLSDQELIAFSRRLGALDLAPIQENGRRFVEGLPEIYIVSNVKVKGEPIGSLGDGEAVWPPTCRTLMCRRRRACSMRSKCLLPAAIPRFALCIASMRRCPPG